VGPECAGAPQCIRSCCCSDDPSALHCLAFAYTQLQAVGGRNDPTLDFLCGHFAVLFGLLMQDNVANQMELLKGLPGISDSVKLSMLLCQAQEFLAVYAAFKSRLFASSMHQNDVSMGGHSDTIAEDKRAESVTHHVILLLEVLCDRVQDLQS
jgi:hypothetical protein